MRVEELTHYGRPYSEIMPEISGSLNKVINRGRHPVARGVRRVLEGKIPFVTDVEVVGTVQGDRGHTHRPVRIHGGRHPGA